LQVIAIEEARAEARAAVAVEQENSRRVRALEEQVRALEIAAQAHEQVSVRCLRTSKGASFQVFLLLAGHS
jgi:hypothetical protein